MADMKPNEPAPGPQRGKKGSGILLVIPFFLVLGALTVVSFIPSLRPTVSYAEKRELAAFPAFSWEALVEGTYFDEINLWFSDTFPGREAWIEASDYFIAFHGYSDIAMDFDVMLEVEPTEPPTEPPEEPTSTEAGATEATEESQVPEENSTDPTEDQWGGIEMEDEAQINLGAVIQIGDSVFNQQGFSEYVSKRYAKVMSDFAMEMAGTDVRVISCPAPTAIGIMVEKEYLEMLHCVPQDEIIDFIHSQTTNGVIAVDTFSNLVAHNDEYLYFRTDHHWTARAAYYAYEQMCITLGMEPVPLEDFEEVDQGEFKGSLYGKARWPQKLKTDNVYAYIPQGDISMMVYYSSIHYGVERDMIADMTNRNVYETYLTFLGGDSALVEITNESIPDGPSCVVIKDSYGNCFVPYLTQHYHKVYAIDYRKYREMTLGEFVETLGIQDVIFAPNLTATQSEDGAGMFRNLCGYYN